MRYFTYLGISLARGLRKKNDKIASKLSSDLNRFEQMKVQGKTASSSSGMIVTREILQVITGKKGIHNLKHVLLFLIQ